MIKQYGFTFAQAIRDWRLWLLGAIFLPLSFAIGGPIPNLETMLGSKGFDRVDAVILASFLGYSVYAGRLIAGYLLDLYLGTGDCLCTDDHARRLDAHVHCSGIRGIRRW